MLRQAADQHGLNTAALAKVAGLDRSELKQVLAGQRDLTVDTFVSLAEALKLGVTDMANLANATKAPTERPELSAVAHQERAELPEADALGNHASQMVRLGFALGCDMVLMLRTKELDQSNIPEGTRDQFPDVLPIRLDAAFHGHNDPRFLPDALTIQLSFDAIYTCTLPWGAFMQVTMVPLHSEAPDTSPEPEAEPGPHLRLVE